MMRNYVLLYIRAIKFMTKTQEKTKTFQVQAVISDAGTIQR